MDDQNKRPFNTMQEQQISSYQQSEVRQQGQTPPTSSTKSPKEKHKSILTPKIYLVILIAAILLVSVAYAGIYFSKNAQIVKTDIIQTAEKQAVSPTPDPTVNWIRYTGSFYTFKYNPEWKISAEVKEPEKEYVVLEVKERSFIYVNVLTEKNDLLITLGGTGKVLSSIELDQFLSTFVLTK